MQTSTITVAVMEAPQEHELRINPKDLRIQTCRGSGPGGQHRNKTESAVQVTHLPTGLQVRCESERAQEQNRRSALALLRARLLERQRYAVKADEVESRRRQVGSGMRGDKRRTIRCQDGQVNDHVTGQRWNLKQYLRGDW